jgi:hypothetical protein
MLSLSRSNLIARNRTLSHEVTGEDLTSGALAGLAAAALMGVVWMFMTATAGQGAFRYFHMVAAAIAGPDGNSGGILATYLGMALHLIAGATAGALFAGLVPRGISLARDVGVGLLSGMVLFVVATYLVMPWVDPIMFHSASHPLLFVSFLVYGLGLSLAVPIRNRLEHRMSTPIGAH